MKLSKLYSNKLNLFEPINFVSGLNAVMAEIRLPENKKKDTHNLGKSTLGRLLDFCFLSKREKKFFLFKHLDIFKEFVFFLEIELEDNSFVTIRRSVKEASKIAFKKHETGHQDFTSLPSTQWDHYDIPFDRAKDLLDGQLDWRKLKPWSYRKVLGYLLRSQDDFHEVFVLRKFRSKHSDWKPFLADILGFDAKLITSYYAKEKELDEKKKTELIIKHELLGTVDDSSKIEGILLLKHIDVKKKQALLDAFDFNTHDLERTKTLVDDIDEKIATLNAKRYSLNLNQKKILKSLQEDQILFSPDEAKKLFGEVGVLFDGQIKKDFEQLIAFNRAITEERRSYLQEELEEIVRDLVQVGEELHELGEKRSEQLSFLTETEVFNKYKNLSDEMVTLRADIYALERQNNQLQHLKEIGTEIRNLTEQCKNIHEKIEKNIDQQKSNNDSLFNSIRVYFSEFIEDVIDRKALLNVSINSKTGHLEYSVEILDSSGNTTSADVGFTYRKLLCIAFDMAVLRAHLKNKFPRFVYHDGVLEALDDRTKENLLAVLREYADLGIQPIITLIDSDLPVRSDSNEGIFAKDEIILKLHDENDSGKIFKMKGW